MEQIAKWIRHNQGMFVALLICALLLVWTFGCPSKVSSLIEPAKMVTAEELNLELDQETARLEAELDMLSKRAALKQADLARQDAIKKKLSDFAAVTAETGGVNPVGLMALLGDIIGTGLLVDNRIKDKVIKNRPLPAAAEGT
jgi:hypothetical protein